MCRQVRRPAPPRRPRPRGADVAGGRMDGRGAGETGLARDADTRVQLKCASKLHLNPNMRCPVLTSALSTSETWLA